MGSKRETWRVKAREELEEREEGRESIKGPAHERWSGRALIVDKTHSILPHPVVATFPLIKSLLLLQQCCLQRTDTHIYTSPRRWRTPSITTTPPQHTNKYILPPPAHVCPPNEEKECEFSVQIHYALRHSNRQNHDPQNKQGSKKRRKGVSFCCGGVYLRVSSSVTSLVGL